MRPSSLSSLFTLCLTAAPLAAQQLSPPDWTASLSLGAALEFGLEAMAVDAAGWIYVTAGTGSSSDVDVLTAAYAPDGTQLWQRVFDGPTSSHDQVRALAVGPFGSVWISGSTANGANVANVLLVEYDASSGTLLRTVVVPSSASESGASLAIDAAGNLYVAGSSGPDALLMKFDAQGVLQWRRLWDGPAFGPFSLDRGLQVALDPAGDPFVLVQGVMAGSLPDYIVLKYAAAAGNLLWTANWGTNAAEYVRTMAVDAAGDVYATGLAMDGVLQKFATIKLDGSTGALLWQVFDHDGNGLAPAVRGMTLDGRGGVYITGSLDPDGNESNNNDDFFTVRRDATSGAFSWSHAFGANCLDCLDLPGDLAVDAAGNLLIVGSSHSPPHQHARIVLALDAATGVQLDVDAQSAGGNPMLGASFVRFDAAQNAIVGGLSRTDPSLSTLVQIASHPPMPTLRAFGFGCGLGGGPVTTLSAGPAPVLPEPAFALDLAPSPLSSLQLIGFALEAELQPVPFGAVGCSLYLDGASWLGAFLAPGGHFALPLPAQLSLRGVRFVAQGVTLASGVDPVTSNGLLIQIGS